LSARSHQPPQHGLPGALLRSIPSPARRASGAGGGHSTASHHATAPGTASGIRKSSLKPPPRRVSISTTGKDVVSTGMDQDEDWATDTVATTVGLQQTPAEMLQQQQVAAWQQQLSVAAAAQQQQATLQQQQAAAAAQQQLAAAAAQQAALQQQQAGEAAAAFQQQQEQAVAAAQQQQLA